MSAEMNDVIETQRTPRQDGRPLAWVYNAYFDTAGGGERSTFIFAKVLEDLGYELVFVSTNPCTRGLGNLLAFFHIELASPCTFRLFESETELGQAARAEGVDVFFNNTYGSSLANPGRIGFFLTMFPHEPTPESLLALETYHSIVVISPFVEWNAQIRWGENLTYELLWIPIFQSGKVPTFPEKEKLILNVGRFNVFGHSKRQREAIQYFRNLLARGVLDESWKFMVIGVVNDSPETNAYVAECRELAKGAPIEIRTDVSTEELYQYYYRASHLWQCTGVGLEFGHAPEHCEHLGLVTLDCFASGVIPIAYHRGGVSGIIEYGVNGYLFGDEAELGEIMKLQAQTFQTAFHERLYRESLRSAAEYSYPALMTKMAEILHRCEKSRGVRTHVIGERYGTY